MKVIKLPNYEPAILYTKDKHVEDDIAIVLEDELIPKGTLDIIDNGEYDVTKYAKANINVAGGEECTGLPLEVEELPEVGIEGAFYKVVKTEEINHLYLFEAPKYVYPLTEDLGHGVHYTLTMADDFPSNPVTTDFEGEMIYTYYIKNMNDLYIYGDVYSEGNNVWITFQEVFNLTSGFGLNIPFLGIVDNPEEIIENGEGGTFIISLTNTTTTLYLFENNEYMQVGDASLLPSGTIDITENGEYDVTKYEKANINVASGEDVTEETDKYTELNDELETVINSLPDVSELEPILQDKSITPTTNEQFVIPDDGYDALSKVTVNPIPDGYIVPTGNIEITENGEYDVTKYEKANVNVDYKALARSIVNKSITAYSDDEITTVSEYAFNGCTKLTSVDLKSTTTIGGYAFTGCSALVNVNLPNAKTVNSNAFQNCTSLTSLSLPKATALNGYVVGGCSALTELNMPNAASGRGYAIVGSKIEHLYLPKFTTPGSSVFREAKYLKTVDIPLLNKLESFLFMDCSALETITFPKVASVAGSAMERCYALAYADLPICNSIAAKSFYNCTALETLILRLTTATCTLANVNAFTGTKIASGEGYIYVPSSRIDSYKTATNWSTYANQFRAIEDYPEICGV